MFSEFRFIKLSIKSKLRFCAQLFATNQVKYVGVIFDEHLPFKRHATLLNAKFKRVHNLIAISRHYLAKKLLIHVCYSQFYSHITYGSQLWGQKENSIEETIILQIKAVKLVSFAYHKEFRSPLFKELIY